MQHGAAGTGASWAELGEPQSPPVWCPPERRGCVCWAPRCRAGPARAHQKARVDSETLAWVRVPQSARPAFSNCHLTLHRRDGRNFNTQLE